jgi:hypothetical protein
MREPGSHSYAAMGISQYSGNMKQQGNRTMTKSFALAASITMLAAISAPAFARNAQHAAPNARYWSETAGPSDRQQAVRAFDAFDAFDPAMAPQMVEPNAYRYHGGPKYND